MIVKRRKGNEAVYLLYAENWELQENNGNHEKSLV